MVTFWRQSGINIVLYLDDGISMSSSQELCSYQSAFVKDSLLQAGFLVNEDKSNFKPIQKVEWLGLMWNSLDYSLSIPVRRVHDCLDTLSKLISYQRSQQDSLRSLQVK